ncbi:pseudouridine synthase family protein [Salidesulfovibrio onnuriiensis]|uniref:pseudouridine synthase family protein n=1 Tax=Salidesulfovibrio onnuriiensis TaxID=2583823 RepID=UPI0011CC8A1F|nr:RluA family pseudouridine synthase [Salidesulfovibrio onnuriiensis]
MNKVQFVEVSPAEAGQKLLQFLERRLGHSVPKTAILRWIRKGEVRVDKGRKKPFDRLEAGQTVRIPPFHQDEARSKETSTRPLDIVLNKKGILAINKPSGLPSHGGEGQKDSVAARLRGLYAEAEFTPSLCHRLDRDTSGLLLAASSYEKLRELNDLFASGKVGKVYLAWVHRQWKEPGTVILEDYMEKRGEKGEEKVCTGSGKQALAEVVCLDSRRERSLLAVKLITGRTHQIRVQLASRKHPIIGDRKYGKKRDEGPLMLHCYSLALPGLQLSLPPDWKDKWQVEKHMLKSAESLA